MKNFILFASIIFSVCLFGDILDSMLDIDSYYSELPVIEIEEPNEDGSKITQYIDDYNDSKNTFKDQRMINYDDSIIETTEIIKEWKAIYKENESYELKLVKPSWKLKKVLAEACVSSDRNYEILDKNIEFYKKYNYSSILVTFDKDDKVEDVIALIDHINSMKMGVWLAYSGNETLNESLFMDPKEFTKVIKNSATKIEAFLMCWRRTSTHLWNQDEKYVNYVCKTLRTENPNILIFGEYYYGTNSNTENYPSVIKLYKKGMTGIVISNFGISVKNQKHIINKIKNIKEFELCDLAGLVIGDSAYYLTDCPNNLSYDQNLEIKRKIERKFLKNGCSTTITLQNDGKDTIQQDLTKTLYNTL